MEDRIQKLEKKILKLDEYYNDEIFHLTRLIQDLEDRINFYGEGISSTCKLHDFEMGGLERRIESLES
jgi:hypothetical protein